MSQECDNGVVEVRCMSNELYSTQAIASKLSVVHCNPCLVVYCALYEIYEHEPAVGNWSVITNILTVGLLAVLYSSTNNYIKIHLFCITRICVLHCQIRNQAEDSFAGVSTQSFF